AGRCRSAPGRLGPPRAPGPPLPRARLLPGLGPAPGPAAPAVPRDLSVLPGRLRRRGRPPAQLRRGPLLGGDGRARDGPRPRPVRASRGPVRSDRRGPPARRHGPRRLGAVRPGPSPCRGPRPGIARSHRPRRIAPMTPPAPDRTPTYQLPPGGLPPQTDLLTDRAMFTESYAVIPRGTLRDIVTSRLPFWEGTRLWVLARPLSGFAETFSQYLMEVAPGGGSDRPDTDPEAESALFVMAGELTVVIDGTAHVLEPGGFAYVPPQSEWSVRSTGAGPATWQWIRKRYQRVEGIDLPPAVVANEMDIEPTPMPDTDGAWATTRFVDPDDIRHDMHVTVVSFEPGGSIPFAETHVMEHGLYVLEGKAVYRLNQDWVEVE